MALLTTHRASFDSIIVPRGEFLVRSLEAAHSIGIYGVEQRLLGHADGNTAYVTPLTVDIQNNSLQMDKCIFRHTTTIRCADIDIIPYIPDSAVLVRPAWTGGGRLEWISCQPPGRTHGAPLMKGERRATYSNKDI